MFDKDRPETNFNKGRPAESIDSLATCDAISFATIHLVETMFLMGCLINSLPCVGG